VPIVLRFHRLDGGNFVSWVNPVASRTPYDVVRDRKAHVEAPRGWHKFWYAVVTLAPLLPGLSNGGAAGALGSAGQLVDAWQVALCKEWLRLNEPSWNNIRSDYEDAGLLVDGGEGDAHGIPLKFRLADALLDHYGLRNGPKTKKYKKSRPTGEGEGGSAQANS